MLAIGLQESRFTYPFQVLDPNDLTRKGPARGYWQFERTGGVRALMRHPRTTGLVYRLLEDRQIIWDETVVWKTLETDHVLAAAFARMLLWADPHALPAATDVKAAWAMYLTAWGPGKPHEKTWAENHRRAKQYYTLQNPSRAKYLPDEKS